MQVWSITTLELAGLRLATCCEAGHQVAQSQGGRPVCFTRECRIAEGREFEPYLGPAGGCRLAPWVVVRPDLDAHGRGPGPRGSPRTKVPRPLLRRNDHQELMHLPAPESSRCRASSGVPLSMILAVSLRSPEYWRASGIPSTPKVQHEAHDSPAQTTNTKANHEHGHFCCLRDWMSVFAYGTISTSLRYTTSGSGWSSWATSSSSGRTGEILAHRSKRNRPEGGLSKDGDRDASALIGGTDWASSYPRQGVGAGR